MASVPMEFRGMLKHTQTRQKVTIDTDWACTGRIGGHDALLAANGAGWKYAAEAVDKACAWFHPDGVVSTGFCGALDPNLGIAEVVVGTGVAASGRRYPALPVRGAFKSATGTVSSVDHVVGAAAEKRALRAEGHAVVEMEAAGVAARARELSLKFYCVRAVTDLAGEDMANNYNAALRSDGHFDTMRIFRHALGRPAVRLPELFRLRGNCVRAANTLGEFFADCKF